MQTITDGQYLILQKLAKYKYLTTSQLMHLDIYKTRNHLRTTINKMTYFNHPIIEKIIFPVHPELGRLENIYYISPHGFNFLVNELDFDENEINYPKNPKKVWFRDYHHRVNTVYIQIYASEWAEKNKIEFDFYYSYYDKEGANNTSNPDILPLRAKPKIIIDAKRYVIPDSVFLFKHNNKDYLFLVEMQNGFDTGLALNKIRLHQEVIDFGLASDKYGIKIDNKTLFVFQLKESKDALLKRIHTLPRIDDFKNHFLFKTLDETFDNFYTGWTQIDGDTTNLI